MNREELQRRTKRFNVDVIRLCDGLPRSAAGFELARQVIRSSGSVGSNYRASTRAKSKADFIHKIEIVPEEADESKYWLEVIQEAELLTGPELERLIKEADELTAIFAATDKTAKRNKTLATTNISDPKISDNKKEPPPQKQPWLWRTRPNRVYSFTTRWVASTFPLMSVTRST